MVKCHICKTEYSVFDLRCPECKKRNGGGVGSMVIDAVNEVGDFFGI